MLKERHQNKVRIIGGIHRSRQITFQAACGLRPSADMVREKLFNWLGQNLYGKSVLDLFSGSGVMGLEAASREAKHVIMVEKNPNTVRQISKNIDILGITSAQIYCEDAMLFLKNTNDKFDIIFLDPPYAWENWDELLHLLLPVLNEDANVYIESNRFISLPEYLNCVKEGKSGMSRFMLAHFVASE